MALLSKGQITIVDLNDAKTLSFALTPNHMAQIYAVDAKKHTPDFGTSNLVIVPQLYDGGATNVMGGTKVPSTPIWKINGEVITGNSANGTKYGASIALASASAPYALTIKKNINKGLSGLNIECEAGYFDSVTGITTKVVAKHTILLTTTAGVTPVILASAPLGYIFDQNHPGPLKLVANLYKGSTMDTTNVSYRWYILRGSAWTEITASAALGCKNGSGGTDFNTDTLLVPSSAVQGFENFKVVITDNDSASGTPVAVEYIFDLHDETDPYKVEVYSSQGGDKLINGQGSITLTADVWQAGTLIENPSTKFNFVWQKRNANATTFDGTWGTAGKKVTQSITVSKDDIDRKAIFVCELHSK